MARGDSASAEAILYGQLLERGANNSEPPLWWPSDFDPQRAFMGEYFQGVKVSAEYYSGADHWIARCRRLPEPWVDELHHNYDLQTSTRSLVEHLLEQDILQLPICEIMPPKKGENDTVFKVSEGATGVVNTHHLAAVIQSVEGTGRWYHLEADDRYEQLVYASDDGRLLGTVMTEL